MNRTATIATIALIVGMTIGHIGAPDPHPAATCLHDAYLVPFHEGRMHLVHDCMKTYRLGKYATIDPDDIP